MKMFKDKYGSYYIQDGKKIKDNPTIHVITDTRSTISVSSISSVGTELNLPLPIIGKVKVKKQRDRNKRHRRI